MRFIYLFEPKYVKIVLKPRRLMYKCVTKQAFTRFLFQVVSLTLNGSVGGGTASLELGVSFTLCQWAETLAGKLDPSRTASIIKDKENVNVSDPDVH